MRNTIRRVLSVFAALVMVLGVMGANVTPVMADDPTYTGKITLDNAVNGQTYKLYKVFDATIVPGRTAGSNGIAYSSNWLKQSNTWFNVDAGGNITITEAGHMENNATQLSAGAINWLKSQLANFTEVTDGEKTATGTTVTWEGLAPGYYYVTSSVGSFVTVNSITPDVTIEDKNGSPLIQKSEDNSTNNIGETVTYTVTVGLVPNSENVVFHDTLSNGLTLIEHNPSTATENAITVKVGNSPLDQANYNVTKFQAVPSANNSNTTDNITITFADSYLKGLATNTDVTITYSATVNNNAIVDENNDAYLDYGNNQHTTHAKVYESTFKFNVEKVKQDNTSALEGAKFILSTSADLGNVSLNDSNELVVKGTLNTTALTSEQNETILGFDDNGNYVKNGGTKIREASNSNILLYNGLDADNGGKTYYLYEVKAPDGYNKLTAPVAIKITPTFDTTENTLVRSYTVEHRFNATDAFETDGTTTINLSDSNSQTTTNVKVPNTQGSLLPSTGGIGTTIFYVIGGVIVAGAIVLLIARRKRNA